MVSIRKAKVQISNVGQQKIIRSLQNFSRRTIGWALIFSLIMGPVSPAMGMTDEDGGEAQRRRDIASSSGSSSGSTSSTDGGAASDVEPLDIEEIRSHLIHHPQDFTRKREKILTELKKEQSAREQNIGEIEREITLQLQQLSAENETLVEVLNIVLSKGKENLKIVTQKLTAVEEVTTAQELIPLLETFLKEDTNSLTEKVVNAMYQTTGITAPVVPSPAPVFFPEDEMEIKEGDPLIQALAVPDALPPDLQARFNAVSAHLAREFQRILEEPNGTASDDRVMLLGSTGAGKTTLNHWLIHQPLTVRADPQDPRVRSLVENPEPDPDPAARPPLIPAPPSTGELGYIASGDRSETHKVYINRDGQSGITYADCPGFQATQGIIQEIKDALYVYKFFKQRAPTKFLLAITPNLIGSHHAVERGEVFKNALKKLKQMVPSLSSRNVGIVLTGYDPTNRDHPLKAQIPERMRSFKETEPNEDIQALLTGFEEIVETEPEPLFRRVGFFPYPTTVGDFSNLPEEINLLNIIRGLDSLDVGMYNTRIPLSPSAFSFLDRLRLQITENLQILLRREVTQRIIDYCKGRILETPDVVDGYLEKAMDEYGFWKKVSIGSSTATIAGGGGVGAVVGASGAATYGVITVFVGSGGTAAAVVTGTAIAAPIIIVPALVAGLVFGAVATSIAFVKKGDFKSKTRQNLKEARKEDLKTQLNSLARIIRGTKFGLENSPLLTDTLPELSRIDPGIAIIDPQIVAEILGEARTLHTITSLLEHSGVGLIHVSFSKNVWEPVFGNLENTLRVLKRKSAEEFYTHGQSLSEFL